MFLRTASFQPTPSAMPPAQRKQKAPRKRKLSTEPSKKILPSKKADQPGDDEEFAEDSEEESEDENIVTGTLDDLVDDDEDMADADDDFSGDENESVEEENMEGVERPVKTKIKREDPESFANAMSKILGSHLKAHDKVQPILVRSKGAERKIEEEKLEYKARKTLTAEKRRLAAKDCIVPDGSTIEYEKKLRKVATRGVVKLFNAIRMQQKMTEEAVTLASSKSKISVTTEKAKAVSTMSKSSFLNLLKTSGGTKTATAAISSSKSNIDAVAEVGNIEGRMFGWTGC
ncbi:Rrp15p-domain-containing protein [Jimgerdemannia flammicorona]|uniref:Rrp15p-domain-containing protein n=1 Tax=Jimgerdemannia flammicorona TaxID=994334 RepID=A0A433QIM2_9FUNG|nr:Rrp15p-domain-containing protein [Jimgerdemannia flammicorona]